MGVLGGRKPTAPIRPIAMDELVLIQEGDSLLGISDFFRQTGVPQLGETLQDHSRDDR